MTNSHLPPTGRDPLTGALTDEPRHDDPTIAAFLADGGYNSITDWMMDSDYLLVDGDDGEPIWVDLDDNPVGAPEGVIESAIEASGFFFAIDCDFADAAVVGAEATADYCYSHQSFHDEDPVPGNADLANLQDHLKREDQRRDKAHKPIANYQIGLLTVQELANALLDIVGEIPEPIDLPAALAAVQFPDY